MIHCKSNPTRFSPFPHQLVLMTLLGMQLPWLDVAGRKSWCQDVYPPSYSRSIISDWLGSPCHKNQICICKLTISIIHQICDFTSLPVASCFFGYPPKWQSLHPKTSFYLPAIALSLLVRGLFYNFMLSTKGTKPTSNPPHGPDELHASKRILRLRLPV